MASLTFVCVLLALVCAVSSSSESSHDDSSSSSSGSDEVVQGQTPCCDQICGCAPGQEPPACLRDKDPLECVFVRDLCRFLGGLNFGANCPCTGIEKGFCVSEGVESRLGDLSPQQKEEAFTNLNNAIAVIAGERSLMLSAGPH